MLVVGATTLLNRFVLDIHRVRLVGLQFDWSGLQLTGNWARHERWGTDPEPLPRITGDKWIRRGLTEVSLERPPMATTCTRSSLEMNRPLRPPSDEHIGVRFLIAGT